MPEKCLKINIKNTQYDRRLKLTDEQREEMRCLRKSLGLSYNVLATKFGVSKRTAIFVCCPEKYDVSRAQFKERRKDGRYIPTNEENATIQREHRAYKRELYKSGKISF